MALLLSISHPCWKYLTSVLMRLKAHFLLLSNQGAKGLQPCSRHNSVPANLAVRRTLQHGCPNPSALLLRGSCSVAPAWYSAEHPCKQPASPLTDSSLQGEAMNLDSSKDPKIFPYIYIYIYSFFMIQRLSCQNKTLFRKACNKLTCRDLASGSSLIKVPSSWLP